jgi:hypothetical protein
MDGYLTKNLIRDINTKNDLKKFKK